MPDEITGGDLYYLWRVSDVHLPRIADAYFDATRLIAGAASTSVAGSQSSSGGPTASHDSDAFRAGSPAYPGASIMTSRVGAAWAGLRDDLQSMYAQVGGVILAGAEGVRKATQGFVDADTANADKLNAYKNDPANHDPQAPASNPPIPGSEEDPGTPSLPAGQQP
ncbi:MAG: hypothetical protein JXA67_14045 [Micromonosporaceae bacterium]|nr:hypothetical protein [Micromonosporaceae bacterium]